MVTVQELKDARLPINRLCAYVETSVREYNDRGLRAFPFAIDKDNPVLGELRDILHAAGFRTIFTERGIMGQLTVAWE